MRHALASREGEGRSWTILVKEQPWRRQCMSGGIGLPPRGASFFGLSLVVVEYFSGLVDCLDGQVGFGQCDFQKVGSGAGCFDVVPWGGFSWDYSPAAISDVGDARGVRLVLEEGVCAFVGMVVVFEAKGDGVGLKEGDPVCADVLACFLVEVTYRGVGWNMVYANGKWGFCVFQFFFDPLCLISSDGFQMLGI